MNPQNLHSIACARLDADGLAALERWSDETTCRSMNPQNLHSIACALLDADGLATLERWSDERLFLCDTYDSIKKSLDDVSEEHCFTTLKNRGFPTFELNFLHYYSPPLYVDLLFYAMRCYKTHGLSVKGAITHACTEACKGLQQSYESVDYSKTDIATHFAA